MDIIISAVLTLFLVMDPFGNIPLFIASLKKVAPERRRFVLMRELGIAFAIMLVFLFIGNQILNFLGIAPYSMNISGGIILFIISIKLVFNTETAEESDTINKDEEPFMVPLAIPLIAGPATLSMLLILTARAGSGGSILILAALLVASIFNGFVLMLSFPISNLLGKRGLVAIERLSGMLLVLMSVNMVMGGIAEFLKTYK